MSTKSQVDVGMDAFGVSGGVGVVVEAVKKVKAWWSRRAIRG